MSPYLHCAFTDDAQVAMYSSVWIELVIGVHPHIFPVTIMRDKVRVRDNIDDAGDNCAGASYFYRYEVNVHTKKVLALRTGCV